MILMNNARFESSSQQNRNLQVTNCRLNYNQMSYFTILTIYRFAQYLIAFAKKIIVQTIAKLFFQIENRLK